MFTRADAAAFAWLARCHRVVDNRPAARRALAAACHIVTDEHRPAGPKGQAVGYRRAYACRLHRLALDQAAERITL